MCQKDQPFRNVTTPDTFKIITKPSCLLEWRADNWPHQEINLDQYTEAFLS